MKNSTTIQKLQDQFNSIADSLGLGVDEVIRRLMPNRDILDAHKNAMKGRGGSSRRLSYEERGLALAMLKRGDSVQSIASYFGVSRPSIYNLRDKENLNLHKRTLVAA